MAALWSERYQPASEEELVITKKRVENVRAFFTLGQSARVLILQGPPGCGKAAVLRAICNDLGYELLEWNPAAHSQAYDDVETRPEPISDVFLRFLARADRYGSLRADREGPRARRVALIRDVPFTLLRPEFLERLGELSRLGAMQRVAFCFNDTRDDHNAVRSLLGQFEPGAALTIQFDSVAKTFVQRALDAVVEREGLLNADTTEIAAECNGDLRQALNALQLLSGAPGARATCSQGGNGRQSGRGRGRGKKRSVPTADFACFPENDTPCTALVARPSAPSEEAPATPAGLGDVRLGLFHSLGRLLYNKRVPPPSFAPAGGMGNGTSVASKRRRQGKVEPQQLPHELLFPKSARPPLYFVPEEVLGHAGTDPRVVADWLFTNAPRFYGSVSDLAEFAGTLAANDALQRTSEDGSYIPEEDRGDAMRAAICARAVLDANLHPVKPLFADPGCGVPEVQPVGFSTGAVFNMQRPRMRDVERLQVRRSEIVRTGLLSVLPRALGVAQGLPLVSRVLPHVDLVMRGTMGNHRYLRYLNIQMMQAVKDLNSFEGRFADVSNDKAASSTSSGMPDMRAPVVQPKQLEEDPIED